MIPDTLYAWFMDVQFRLSQAVSCCEGDTTKSTPLVDLGLELTRLCQIMQTTGDYYPLWVRLFQVDGELAKPVVDKSRD